MLWVTPRVTLWVADGDRAAVGTGDAVGDTVGDLAGDPTGGRW